MFWSTNKPDSVFKAQQITNSAAIRAWLKCIIPHTTLTHVLVSVLCLFCLNTAEFCPCFRKTVQTHGNELLLLFNTCTIFFSFSVFLNDKRAAASCPVFERILPKIRHTICFIFKWVISWFWILYSLIPGWLCYLENMYNHLYLKLLGVGPRKRSICCCPTTKHRAQALSSSGWFPWRAVLHDGKRVRDGGMNCRKEYRGLRGKNNIKRQLWRGGVVVFGHV